MARPRKHKQVMLLLTSILLLSPFRDIKPNDGVLAITNVTIVNVANGTIQLHMTIIVVGNRIQTMGLAGSFPIPIDARIVDGSDKFVIPGLWDMHVHVFNPVSARSPNEWYFPGLLAHGVTALREMATKPEDMPRVREWRTALERGQPIPRITLVGTLVEGEHPAWPNSYSITNANEAREMVHRIRASGVDFVKVYSTLSSDVFFAIAEETKRIGIPFAGHVPIAVDAGDASDAGQRSMEHLNELLESGCSRRAEELRAVTWHEWTDAHLEFALDSYDEERCQRLFYRFVQNGTVHVPTLVNERMKQLGAEELTLRMQDLLFQKVPSHERDVWKNAVTDRTGLSPVALALRKRFLQAKLRLVEAMHKSGVVLMAGTDLGNEFLYPGLSLLEELELFVQAGMTPKDAISAATLVPATFAQMADSLGSIEPGKLADLVLLDANPLEHIGNLRRVHCVVLNGKIVHKADTRR